VKTPAASAPIIAMINMDMIGRDEDEPALHQRRRLGQGVARHRAPACAAQRVECQIGGSGYGPSDHMPFYIAGSPVLFFFTGSHSDYHTATDDADKINAIGGARIAAIAADATVAVASIPQLTTSRHRPSRWAAICRGAAPRSAPSRRTTRIRRGPRAWCCRCRSRWARGARRAQGGDRITQIDTHEVANASDLMFVLTMGKPGQETKITYVRDARPTR